MKKPQNENGKEQRLGQRRKSGKKLYQRKFVNGTPSANVFNNHHDFSFVRNN